MRWIMSCAMFVLLWGNAYAHTGDVYVSRVAPEIEVDGDLSDWPQDVWKKATYYRTILSEPENEADFRAEFAVMWRDSLLYLAARVTDDVHVSVHTDGNIYVDDCVRFSFTPQHEPDLWNSDVSWGYGLSSVTQDVMAVPTGRFSGVPKGLVYVAQIVKRDEKKGQTIYEAVARAPFEISHGAVYGFGFTASDNDGFHDGSVSTSVRTLTMPGNGGGDVIFVNGDSNPVRVSGRVTGLPDGTRALVYAFQNDVLKGSTTSDTEGAFEMALLSGTYQVLAYAGEKCCKRVEVAVGSQAANVALALDERTGTLRGQIVGIDGKTPVAFASVFASMDGSLRARVFSDDDGRFVVMGLEAGTYDLTCNVADGDTVKAVTVARGEIVDLPKPIQATLSFDREPADDAVYEVLENWLDYDRNLPFDVDVVERREVANYVREKIVFSSTHDERVIGYLALPKTGKKPFPCLVTVHAHDNLGKDRDDMEMLRRRFTEKGYAVLALDSKYYNERHHKGQTVYDMRGQGFRRRDANLQTIVDYRRALDFLGTRSEIDTSRIGVFGGSMGSLQAMILVPLEPRIKAVVLRGPGLWADQWNLSPTDQVNFLSRMGARPVLIFNGPYDRPWAPIGTQRILKLLPGETTMVWYRTSHTVPPELYLEKMLSWVGENL